MSGHELMIEGELTAKPEERRDARGKYYTVAHVNTEHQGRQMAFFVICFVPKVSFTLQRLEPGDTVQLYGRILLLDSDNSTAVGISPRRIKCSTQPPQRRARA